MEKNQFHPIMTIIVFFLQTQNLITFFFKPTSESFVTCEGSIKSESHGGEEKREYKPTENSPALSRTPISTQTNAASQILEKDGATSALS